GIEDMKQLVTILVITLASSAPLAAQEGSASARESSSTQSAAGGAAQQDQPASPTEQSPYGAALESGYASSGDPFADAGLPASLAMRFGWWGTKIQGSPNKIGEYQSLKPSPFFDVDGLLTNSVQTLDFTVTGMDNEDDYARFFY